MSQVARVKKMFDDISSFSEEDLSDDKAMQDKVNVLPQTYSAQHVDPALRGVTTFATTSAHEVHSDGDTNAFALKLASGFQNLAEPESAGGDAEQVTMVARVSISLTPKQSPRVAPSTPPPAQALVQVKSPSAIMRAHQQPASTQPGTSSPKRSALGNDSAYSTPTALSHRQEWREEVEDVIGPRKADAGKASSRKDRRYSSPDVYNSHGKKGSGGTAVMGAEGTPSAQYREKKKREVVPLSTMENRGERYSTQYRSDDSENYEMQEQYTPVSMNQATAAQIGYRRPEYTAHCGAHAGLRQVPNSDDNADDDFPCTYYIFPRLNPAFADYQGSRTTGAAVKRGEMMPPNVVERYFAYLMVTDIHIAVYLVVLFLSVVLVVVSILTSQLDIVNNACLTYWGYKNNCDSSSYTITRRLYPCAGIRHHLGAGAAFSIITLVVYLVNFIAVIIVVFCLKESPHTISLKSRMVVSALGCVTVVAQLISWAVVARIYNANYCPVGELAYGVGFGLNLSSWVMNIIGVTLVLAAPTITVDYHL
nr:unnamed protein product [Leishmania braziliensis]